MRFMPESVTKRCALYFPDGSHNFLDPLVMGVILFTIALVRMIYQLSIKSWQAESFSNGLTWVTSGVHDVLPADRPNIAIRRDAQPLSRVLLHDSGKRLVYPIKRE